MKSAPLDELCEINVGRTPARANPAFWGRGEPWLSIADMNQGRLVTRTKEQITPAGARAGKQVPAGTVLLSFKLSIGKVAIAGVPLYTNEAIAALPIRNPRRLDARFLMRALEAMDLSAGSNRAAMGATLNKAGLARILIPVPGLEDQRRIAAILDRADAVRAKRSQVLAHLNSLTQSILDEMFGGRDWTPAELSEVVREGSVVTYGIVQAGPEFEGGVPYIRTGDIVGGEIDVPRLRRTDPRVAARFQRSTVRSGDIVMSIRATVGTTAVVPPAIDGANLTQGTARIAPGEFTTGAYLLGYLRSHVAQRWIQAQVKGATFREITLGRLRELPVPLPPLDLQRDFSRRAEALNRQRTAVLAAEHADDELFASLQSRAFNGDL